MADSRSLALRSFLGFELSQATPDHSTISRTRRLIDVETHRKVFLWVLGMLAEEGLLKGNTVAIDGTTLEANAALRFLAESRTMPNQKRDDMVAGLWNFLSFVLMHNSHLVFATVLVRHAISPQSYVAFAWSLALMDSSLPRNDGSTCRRSDRPHLRTAALYAALTSTW